MSMDWLPTLAHYGGVALPDRRIDGKNIADLIASAQAPSPHETVHWETGGGKHWAVRSGPWKLVHRGPATRTEDRQLPAADTFLSRLDRDVTETVNRAEAHPEIVERLTRLHEQWVEDVKSP
jgi:arylsulfatase A-like enzyme